MKIVQTCQLLVPGLVSVFLLHECLVTPFRGAYAQVVPDATLGPESSLVTPDTFIRGDYADLIEGGATRGSALFHSFENFSVLENQRVYFANPIGIENILSRVTGLNPSQIDGLLGVDGVANLFFLNPNGIIFGPNARLDVEGAFLASTSDRFQFADGTEFRATDPNDAPLVTVNISLGLQLGPDAPAAVVSSGNLEAGEGLTLSAGSVTSTGRLAAPNGTVRVEGVVGDVQVQTVEAQSAVLQASEDLILTASQLVTRADLSLGAAQTVQIRDSESAPFIASAGGDLLVAGAETVDIFALNHPESGLYAGGDLVLRSANPVIGDAHYFAYGNFRIEDLEQNLGDLISPNDPVVRASGDVSFDSYTGASLHILAGGSVNVSGNITVDGTDGSGLVETVTLSDGSPLDINGQTQETLDIRAGTFAVGAPGIGGGPGTFVPAPPNTGTLATSANISIGSITLQGQGQVFLTTNYFPNFGLPGGDINITGTNGSDYSISAFADKVTIDARDDINVNSSIVSGVGTLDSGDLLDGGNVRLLSGDQINLGAGPNSWSIASIANNGNGGDIFVEAVGKVTIDGVITSEFADIKNLGNTADGGNITVISNTDSIAIKNVLSSETNRGNAGNISIRASKDISTNSINSESDSKGTAAGNSGSVEIDSEFGSITVSNIINSKSQEGRAGQVRIIGNQNVQTGSVTTISESEEQGDDAGSITIISEAGFVSAGNLNSSTTFTKQDDLTDSGNVLIEGFTGVSTGSISTTSVGGDSGSVSILSQTGNINTVTLKTSSTTGSSRNIELNANTGSVTISGLIETSSFSGQRAGEVEINALNNITTRGISTKVFEGEGSSGNILIDSELGGISNLIGEISSDAEDGAAGEIMLTAAGTITTRDVTTTSRDGFSGNILIQSTAGDINTALGDIRSDAQGSAIKNAQAGKVSLIAAGDIETADVTTTVQFGSSGTINIISNNGSIDTTLGTLNAESTASLESAPGDITLAASGNVKTASIVTKTQTGNSGSIVIETVDGAIDTSLGNLNSKTDVGNAGKVQLIAQGTVTTGNIATSVQTGNSGDILLQSTQAGIDTSLGELISEATTGNAGNVELIAVENIKTANVTTQTVTGESGNISMTSENGLIDIAAGELTSKTVDGKAGTVILDSPVDISVQAINTSTKGAEDAADIKIGNDKTNTVVIVGGSVTSSSEGTGNSGSIFITGNTIRIASNAQVLATATGGGNAGSIEIKGNSVKVSDSEVSTTSSGTGNAGSVTFTVSNDGELAFRNSLIASESNGEALLGGDIPGKGGGITLSANTIAATDSLVAASATQNNAGSVAINADTSVVLGGKYAAENRGGVVAEAIESGQGGNITVNTPELIIQNGAQIEAGATGIGDAGFIKVDATTITLTNGGGIATVTEAGDGKGEGIQLGVKGDLQTLTVVDSQISASTGSGIAGGVTVKAADSVSLIGTGGISASAGNDMATGGQGGSIDIITPQLTIAGAEIAASATNTANAGAITIESATVTLDEGGQITAKTVAGNAEKGIKLNNLQTLDVTNSIISASTETGTAGSILVEASDAVTLTGTFADQPAGISASAGKVGQAGGSGGDIGLTTEQLRIQAGAEIAASAISTANAGRITIDATTIAIDSGGQITASTQAGKGDTVGIQLGGGLQSLSVTDGLISSSTKTGIAGGIQVTAADSIQLLGRLGDQAAGISAAATDGGTAGSVTLETSDFQVRNGAAVTVSSPSGIAGSLTVRGDRITLSQGTLASEAGLGDGSANITLDLSRSTALNNFLWLENESLISASALGKATGGNIDIDADFIFGFYPTGPDGSDIVANAELGNGGAIAIDALGVFGLQFRLEPTPLNDITASSDQGLQGSVALNTLATDPNSGLVELTLEFIDASKQTLNQCSPSAAAASSVIQVAGRGGLPNMPTAILSAATPADDWVTLAPPETGDAMSSTVEVLPTKAQFSQPSSLCHSAYQASQSGL